MIISTKVEIALSGKASGFRFVKSDNVAVVSVSGERTDGSTPMKAVLQTCAARFETILTGWLQALPGDRVQLFAATPPSDQQNALSRRRGIWQIQDLRWLPLNAPRSASIEIAWGTIGSRFAGLTEVAGAFVEAADFVRTHDGCFLLVSSRRDLTEERVRTTVAKVFPMGRSSADWAAVVALVEQGEDICIRASGGFDDREASLDAFLRSELLRSVGVP